MKLRLRSWPALVVLAAACHAPNAGGAPASTPPASASPPPTVWSNGVERLSLELVHWPTDGKIPLSTPASNVVALWLQEGASRAPLRWSLNAEATKLVAEAAGHPPPTLPAILQFETAEKTAQSSDGRIVFSALDATIEGQTARLESQPGNHRIGFWTNAKDAVSWSYKPTRWGRYDVELAFSADGGNGTELAIDIAGQTFTVRRPSTGSWYCYATLPVGRVYVAKAEPFVLRVRCLSLTGGAVMNLKAAILRPAPEGEPIVQDPAGGDVLLRAREAITHSTVMRYEPATNKNCLGYWVNARDAAEWQFTLLKPGTYDVEVWQGCGRGNGGSEVAVQTAGRTLSFQVEDTGHFQNFVPRRVGRVTFNQTGPQSLFLRPTRKQAGAVMDVREVRLRAVLDASLPTVP